jgi:hypothetical protein
MTTILQGTLAKRHGEQNKYNTSNNPRNGNAVDQEKSITVHNKGLFTLSLNALRTQLCFPISNVKVAHIKRDLMCNLMAGRIAQWIKR